MWRYATAQTTGASHLRKDAPCQDRCRCILDAGTVIIAVADGAGSAPLSQIGADIAVTTAVNLLRGGRSAEATWEDRVLRAATAARQAVLSEALATDRSPRDFACTLLLVVLDEHGGAALQIGDGLIAYRDHEAWGWLFWPQKGEYANTTHFLTQEDAEQSFESAAIEEPFMELAVMTDGLEGLALHLATRTVHEPFLEAVMTPLRKPQGYGEAASISAALTDFLKSERITSRTDDDLTLVLVARASP